MAQEKSTKFDNVFLAVYSGIPVWEYITNTVSVMRRKGDSWLNATQLLKVANVEKARRTKILEREWATDAMHEKVQGGYGKYQGTWIPFERGVLLCEQYKISHLVAPLLDFDPKTMTALPKPSNHASRAVDRDSSASTTASNDHLPRKHLNRYSRNEAAAASRASHNKMMMAANAMTLMEPLPQSLLSSPAHNSSFLFNASHANPHHYHQMKNAHGIFQMAKQVPAPSQTNQPSNVKQSFAPNSQQMSTNMAQGGLKDGDSSVDVSPYLLNKSLNRNEPFPYPQYSFYHTYPDETLSVPSNKLPHFNITNDNLVNGVAVSPLSAHFDMVATYASDATPPLLPNTTTTTPPPAPLPLHHSIVDKYAAFKNQWMSVFLAGSDVQAMALCQFADKSDLNLAIDSEGNTPMHWATALARVHILQVLVSNNANPIAQNKAGETPLMRAVSTSHNADMQTFLLILSTCAVTFTMVSLVDHKGQSVFHHLIRSVDDKSRKCTVPAAMYYLQTIVDYLAMTLRLDKRKMKQLARITDANGFRAIDLAASMPRHHELVDQLLRMDPSMVVRAQSNNKEPATTSGRHGGNQTSTSCNTRGSRSSTAALVTSRVDSKMMIPAAVIADRVAGMSE